MAISNDESFIREAIKQAVRNEIEKISAEEIEAAQKRIVERVRGAVDRMALSVMSQYEMSTDTRGVHIVVKKEI